MKKIPTIMKRDYDGNPARVLPEVTPGCEWVLAGEGRATRKYDGLCVLIRRDGLAVKTYTRRMVRLGKGKKIPPHFEETDYDPRTETKFGWIPSADSGYQRYIDEALADGDVWLPGTYELIGPKINHNGEKAEKHQLLHHATAPVHERLCDLELDLATIEGCVISLANIGWEGVVWHHPDGRMAKIKARDFGAKVA